MFITAKNVIKLIKTNNFVPLFNAKKSILITMQIMKNNGQDVIFVNNG